MLKREMYYVKLIPGYPKDRNASAQSVDSVQLCLDIKRYTSTSPTSKDVEIIGAEF